MAEVSKVDKLTFSAQWFDPEASIVREFLFCYFPSDCTVEMFDTKNHKLFLKRTQCGLQLKDIFIGNTVKIFSRQIKIVDYADNITKKKMSIAMQRSFGLIKPDGIEKKGEILCCLFEAGFQISRLKMTLFSKDEASQFYKDYQGKSFFPYLLDHITSGPVIGMELLAENAVERWLNLAGPTDPAEAKTKCSGSLRARFGQDSTRNLVHASKSLDYVEKETSLFFGSSLNGLSVMKPIADFNDSTCCVIKPHAVQEGLVGRIINMIERNSFIITGLQLFCLDEVNAEEFLEIYRGVVPEYMSMVKQLSSGPCVAMEIKSSHGNCNVAVEFRKLVGPAEPEIAKRIRPNTIRAHFGKTKVENGVHVTDLPEDSLLEVEYFFKILSS